MMSPQILRQILIVFGLMLFAFSEGYIMGQMSGMLAALQRKEDILLSDVEISWIASVINITCPLGFGVAAVVADRCGRRRALTYLSTPIIVNWITLYFAETFAVLLISRIIVGVFWGGVHLLAIITTAEFTSPNMRAPLLSMLTTFGVLGIAAGHLLGIVLHWRVVALIGIIPAVTSAIIPYFWVESPQWLASKGYFKECEVSFNSLHKHRSGAQEELKLLLEVEKAKLLKKSKRDKIQIMIELKNRTQSILTKPYLWKITAVTLAMALYRTACGKVLFSTFAITMIQDITGVHIAEHNLLYFTLLVDGFAFMGSAISFVLMNQMKMRQLLFSGAIAANILLIALSGIIYWVPSNDGWLPWIKALFLAFSFITINAGPCAVVEAMFGELYPLEIKMFCLFYLGIIIGIFMFMSVKFAPMMFINMGYHGVFLFNVIAMSICLLYLWKNMPETKGKTLSEIELYFKNGSCYKDVVNHENNFLI